MWQPPVDSGGAGVSEVSEVVGCGASGFPPEALVDFYRVQADDGLGGAFQDVAVVAGTYTTVECGPLEFAGYRLHQIGFECGGSA